MPYIPKERREEIIAGDFPENAGEINFAISAFLNIYVEKRGGLRYEVVNEVVGALECAKLELYRRLAAPYEDIKCEDNGDVYECQ